jgi:hypothetical protein
LHRCQVTPRAYTNPHPARPAPRSSPIASRSLILSANRMKVRLKKLLKISS